jgi:hypothetical protein
MKGSFSPKVMDAIKTMKPKPPIAIPWPVVQDDHLLEEEIPSTFNISSLSVPPTGSPLQFPTPTVDSEVDHNELRKRQVMAIGGVGAAGAAAAVDQHTVPFGEQTGLTKYAPMPFSIATTYLGAPTVQYTDMAYATWTAHSIENTVCLIPLALCELTKSLTFARFRLLQLPSPPWTRECRSG